MMSQVADCIRWRCKNSKMPSCAVYLCKNTDRNCAKKISFFTFPKETIILKKWIKACGRKDEINITGERVCSIHFKDEDFENFSQYQYGFKPILKLTVIPNLHLKGYKKFECDQTNRSNRFKRRCIRKNALERLKTLSPNNNKSVCDSIQHQSNLVNADKEQVTMSIQDVQEVENSTNLIEHVQKVPNSIPDDQIAANSIPDVQIAPNSIPVDQKASNSIPDVQISTNSIPDAQNSTNSIPDVQNSTNSIPGVQKSKNSIPGVQKSKNSIPDVQKSTKSVLDVQKSPNSNLNSIEDVQYCPIDHDYSNTSNNFEGLKREIDNLKAQNKDLRNKLINANRTTLVMEAKLRSRQQQIIRAKQTAEKWQMNWLDATKKLKKQTELERCSRILNKIFTRAQIRHLKNEKRVQWDKEDIDKAIELQKVGLKAYNYVRDQLKIPLPGLTTIRRWNSSSRDDSGILKNLLSQKETNRKLLITTDFITN